MARPVLIVDDDPVQRRIVEAAVSKFGYETLVADGGEAALAAMDGPRGRDIAVLPLEGGQPAENEKAEVPAVQQKERRHNRQQKQRNRRREPAEDPDADVNTGSFGDDIPSFLQKR